MRIAFLLYEKTMRITLWVYAVLDDHDISRKMRKFKSLINI